MGGLVVYLLHLRYLLSCDGASYASDVFFPSLISQPGLVFFDLEPSGCSLAIEDLH